MARVYKVELYIIDYNDEIQSKKSLVNMIDQANTLTWVSPKVTDIQQSREFEWDDELAINKTDSNVDDFEVYLRS